MQFQQKHQNYSYQKFKALLITKSHQPFSLLPLNESRRYTNPVLFNRVTSQSSKTSTTSPHPRTPAFLSEIFYHANYTIGNCYIANCTIVGCYLAHCTIANSYLANCTIRNSYLANCTTESCYRAIWTIEYWYRENCTIAQRCLADCNRKCLSWKLHHEIARLAKSTIKNRHLANCTIANYLAYFHDRNLLSSILQYKKLLSCKLHNRKLLPCKLHDKKHYPKNRTIANCYLANCTIEICYLTSCKIGSCYLANCAIGYCYLPNCTMRFFCVWVSVGTFMWQLFLIF